MKRTINFGVESFTIDQKIPNRSRRLERKYVSIMRHFIKRVDYYQSLDPHCLYNDADYVGERNLVEDIVSLFSPMELILHCGLDGALALWDVMDPSYEDDELDEAREVMESLLGSDMQEARVRTQAKRVLRKLGEFHLEMVRQALFSIGFHA